MDIIDNILFANLYSPVQPIAAGNTVISDYIAPPFAGAFPPLVNFGGAIPLYSYNLGPKMTYCSYGDSIVIERAILRHWYDINGQMNYDYVNGLAQNRVRAFGTPLLPGDIRFSSFEQSSNYHLIYAYLLENTRMFQIFERLIERYLDDEEFGIADNVPTFNWIQNTERLFFKSDTPRSSNLRSLIRPSSDATRRNAYWRMFGMDLSFGDINSQGTGSYPYVKAKNSNQQFVVLFERFLSEVWQGYINARNQTGVNTADINIIVDLALQLREILIARRGDVTATTYANLNLSHEEFSSVLLASWFAFIVSDNTPVVEFLNCQSSTIGERLLKLGAKVGIPAHSKSQSLFEMAGPAATVLSVIELGGFFDNEANMQNILIALNPPVVPSVLGNYMTDLLTVINHWEKATGHKIKNPEANITATLKMRPGTKAAQKPTLN